MNIILKKAKVDADGSHFFDIDDIVGTIRLWEEGNPPVPTDKYILIGDFPVNSGETVKGQDTLTFSTKMDDIFKSAKAQLSDYSRLKKRNFRMDIYVPKSVIDGYTG